MIPLNTLEVVAPIQGELDTHADGRDGSPSRPSVDDRCSTVTAPPPAAALSEKSPYQQSPYQQSPYQQSPYQQSPYQVLTPPIRKRLPHEIPPWVGEGAVFFITINCQLRGRNQLVQPSIADCIDRSLHHQHSRGEWWIHLFLLMPDHLHALLSFSQETSMEASISNWKRFVARQAGIVWQRDFFDHRLRRDESLNEKWNYIRQNPVRKGLVATPDDWPFQWTPGRDGSPSRPSVDDRCSTVIASPPAAALSEKSPYQQSPPR
jgi:REP element-mobilizing transposase RayT